MPGLAGALNTSVDALLGYAAPPVTQYENRYDEKGFYWGLQPNELCYEIMRLKPPVKPLRVLDIGCGEGKDAVFLARNGYAVTAFDAADTGIGKARTLAEKWGVRAELFKADMLDYTPDREYDIVFSSGVFHYLPRKRREPFIRALKAHTPAGGLHVINVFVEKPFILPAPDLEEKERQAEPWLSGELFTYYHDWLLHKTEERVFDCSSGGTPHKHCMNILIAEKV